MEPRLAIVFVLAALACGCTIPIPTDGCRSGLFTDEGDCCNYVCEKSCTHGFVEGSCNCECLQITTEEPTNIGAEDEDPANIDSVFGEEDISPPVLPE